MTAEKTIVNLAETLFATEFNPQGLPIFSGEDGELYCVGHIPTEQYLKAVQFLQKHWQDLPDDHPELEYIIQHPEDVRHVWAQGYVDPYGDIRFDYCASDAEAATPMTIWEF